jgi:hypothetical protein
MVHDVVRMSASAWTVVTSNRAVRLRARLNPVTSLAGRPLRTRTSARTRLPGGSLRSRYARKSSGSLRSLDSLRSRRAGWTHRTDVTLVAFHALRTRRPGRSLRAVLARVALSTLSAVCAGRSLWPGGTLWTHRPGRACGPLRSGHVPVKAHFVRSAPLRGVDDSHQSTINLVTGLRCDTRVNHCWSLRIRHWCECRRCHGESGP